MVRLFFANKPSSEVRLAIAQMGQGLIAAHGLQGHVMDAGRLHLTLAAAWAEHLSLQEAIWRAQNSSATREADSSHATGARRARARSALIFW